MPLAPTLRTVLEPFNAVDRPDDALTRVGELGPRAGNTYRYLVEKISQAHADVRVTWPGMAGAETVVVRHDKARKLVGALRNLRVRADGRYYVGVLDEASRRKERFGFTASDGQRFDGLVETEILDTMRDHYDRPCRAYILTRGVGQPKTGAVKRAHRLQELLSVDADGERPEEHYEKTDDGAFQVDAA